MELNSRKQSSRTMILLLNFLSFQFSDNATNANSSRDLLQNGSSDTKVAEHDLSSGAWIHDSSYPLYDYSQCPLLSHHFSCQENGRPDSDYEKWRWQPDGYSIPRFDAAKMMDRLRGKRMMFVGDSISQNHFQSMGCLLHAMFPNTENRSATILTSPNYNASIESSWAPYLVYLEKNSQGQRVLHLDVIENNGMQWKGVDILVFESSKWWPDHLGFQRWDMIMEGKKIYKDMDPMVAYQKTLTTWVNWISANIDPKTTLVFFRGISFSHYDGVGCLNVREPVLNPSYNLPLPPHVKVLQQVLATTHFPVHVLNITRSTMFRKDAHASIYGSIGGVKVPDCTHWCLPGVPDSWNELLYAFLVNLRL